MKMNTLSLYAIIHIRFTNTMSKKKLRMSEMAPVIQISKAD